MGLGAIAGALFSTGVSAPSVRRPAFEVQFGSASADDWGQAVVGFTVELGTAPFVDAAEIHAAAAHGPTAASGDTGTIKAGYEDTSTDAIFAGAIETTRYTVDGLTRYTAVTGAALLARLRVNQSYEQSAAGDIVRDLAGRAGVDTDTIEDGATYPFYPVDDRRTGWQHVAMLARSNGFLAYFSSEGKLNFKPVEAGQPAQTFTYGADILAVQLFDAPSLARQVTVVGEGAAGSNGSDAWPWLLKDAKAAQAQSGSGGAASLVEDPSLRSVDAAQTAADTIAGAMGASALRGWLLTPGAPAAAPGAAIEIASAPQDALNGTCVVERVRHRFSKRLGFTSTIWFTKTGSAGAPAAGGLIGAVKGLL